FFVVPMNAVLQHRGHVLMGAGHSIAVQNFNENIGVLVMLAFYGLLVYLGLSTNTVILLFGLLVAGVMALVMWRHCINLARGNLDVLVGEQDVDKHATILFGIPHTQTTEDFERAFARSLSAKDLR